MNDVKTEQWKLALKTRFYSIEIYSELFDRRKSFIKYYTYNTFDNMYAFMKILWFMIKYRERKCN